LQIYSNKMSTFCNTELCRFICEKCHYHTNKKSSYENHLLSSKHNLSTTSSSKALKLCSSYECDICSKQFAERTGLWRHKKKCYIIKHPQPTDETITPVTYPDDIQQSDLIFQLISQNKDFKELLIQQSNQLLEQNKTIIELSKNNQVNNNTFNNNSHNKTFNLQVFLNETCKDAMNIKDFIQSLELNLTDLEKVGELGYAEGISRMFIKGLNNLEITKRPIHCSDVKREIMHIKHEDKWEKDNANQDKLKNIIKQLTHKNIMMLDDWKKANPGCTEYNSKKYDHYLKLTMESMGPCDDAEEKRDFNKIIRRIAESTAIDKKYLMV
jgi:hypothetical protein